jgi:protein SCO1/2
MKYALCLRVLVLTCLLTFPELGLTAQQAETENTAQRYFSDVVLLNQDGQEMRLYTDLLKGKVVVINTFFGSCTGVCPMINRKLIEIQHALGDRLGDDVYILSLSVDPLTDTPPRLKTYAERIKAKPGWYFLTGEQANVDFALRKIGQHVQAKEGHSNLLIVGNEPTGLWKKMFGLAKTEELVKLVQGVLNDQ